MLISKFDRAASVSSSSLSYSLPISRVFMIKDMENCRTVVERAENGGKGLLITENLL